MNMKDIDTCQHGLRLECPEIANPAMADFIALVKKFTITVESIDAVNEICGNCASFTPKE